MTEFVSFRTLKRPAKPNTYLLAPPDLCLAAEPDAAAPSFSMSSRGLFSQLSEIIAGERSWGHVVADAEALRLKFIARTSLMRFRDDVDIMVIAPDAQANNGENAATLAIYSRSRVGYSDLGANKKRVDHILAKLTAK